MRRRSRQLLIGLLGGGGVVYGDEDTVVLQAGTSTVEDTRIQNNAPTSNLGTDQHVFIGELNTAAAVVRTLIKFDLSSIPAQSLIVSATLSLFADQDHSSNARTFRVFRLKRAWVETEATWNIYSTGNNWQTAGGFGANDCEQTQIGSRDFTATEALNQFKDFPLTATLKEDLDLGNGWLIKADTESDDGYRFQSSNHVTAVNRPKLTVIFRPPL